LASLPNSKSRQNTHLVSSPARPNLRNETVFRENTGEANGLMFGPDGRLYACQNGRKRIVAFAPDGTESVIAEGVTSNDLAVNPRGEIYFSDPPNKQVWFIDARGNKRVVHQGILLPNGVRFSPDHAFLMVADTLSRWVWSFSVSADGSLANGVPGDPRRSGLRPTAQRRRWHDCG
jgi:sugar lactone lactonase YvrE